MYEFHSVLFHRDTHFDVKYDKLLSVGLFKYLPACHRPMIISVHVHCRISAPRQGKAMGCNDCTLDETVI
jgi:hypothetical protein